MAAKKATGTGKPKKPLTELQKHNERICECNELTNPNFCVYQPFLDGWDFTPDVGNGQKRGEIFTPRFVVDKMIILSGILHEDMVKNYKYAWDERTLRKYIDKRVFEPAVGTGNFIATILWHKLELINELTKPKKGNIRDDRELARYQAYTMVALASLYVNDIDLGNLQATKMRILRDSIINTDANISFWEDYLKANIEAELDAEKVKTFVEESIKAASANWDTFDEDKGILDVLYKKHNNGRAPDAWLMKAWRDILDENARLFNGIVLEDTVEEGFICPGYKNVVWTFWRFSNNTKQITAHKAFIPISEQLKESELVKVKKDLSAAEAKGVSDGDIDALFVMEDELSFDNKDDEKKYNATKAKKDNLEQEIANFKPKHQTVIYSRE